MIGIDIADNGEYMSVYGYFFDSHDGSVPSPDGTVINGTMFDCDDKWDESTLDEASDAFAELAYSNGVDENRAPHFTVASMRYAPEIKHVALFVPDDWDVDFEQNGLMITAHVEPSREIAEFFMNVQNRVYDENGLIGAPLGLAYMRLVEDCIDHLNDDEEFLEEFENTAAEDLNKTAKILEDENFHMASFALDYFMDERFGTNEFDKDIESREREEELLRR